MARCGCASDQCSCTVIAGENVEVNGGGSRNNPYVISAATQVVVEGGEGGGSVDRLTGEVIAYGGAAAPTGWLLCDGTAVNRAVYSDLFAALGTSYGAGDGSTTFNVPDLVGRFPMGADGTDTRGTEGGSATTTLAAANLPAHLHTNNHTHAATSSSGLHDHQLTRSANGGGTSTTIAQGEGAIIGSSGAAIADDGAHTHTVPAYTGTTGSTGSGTPVATRPPFTALNYLIKT